MGFNKKILGNSLEQIKVAVESPVHAYIFSGPPSFPSLTQEAHPQEVETLTPAPLLQTAAYEFCAQLFSAYGIEHEEGARKGLHVNISLISPEGRTFRVADASRVIDEVNSMPRKLKGESNIAPKKVVICDQFHTADESVATRLLKVIEEPPPSAILILLTEEKLPDTIVSRCYEINFSSAPSEVVRQYLSDEHEVPDEHIETLVDASGGDLGKANFLANSYERRLEIWGQLSDRSLGNDASYNGSAVISRVQLVKDFLDEMNESLSATHISEEALKRQKRKLRDTEIRFGLFILQRKYRQQLLNNSSGAKSSSDDLSNDNLNKDELNKSELKENNDRHLALIKKVERLTEASNQLERNPNESIFLTNLFYDLI